MRAWAPTAALVIRWVAGLFLSTLLVWALGAVTLDSPLPYVWNDQLERYVVPAGRYVRATEGYAWTETGAFAINGVEDARQLSGPILAIWGDSYVDARHVPDEQKMAQVLTRILQSRSSDSSTAVGLGMEGWCVADIWHQMPQFEQLLTRISHHFIVVADFADFEAIGEGRSLAFVSHPKPSFVEVDWQPEHQSLKSLISQTRSSFAWWLLKDAAGVSVRFAPGRVESRTKEASSTTEAATVHPVAEWRFALQQLRQQTSRPITIVYIPPVPGLASGQIATNDPFEDKAVAFRRIAKEEGVGFINLYGDFASLPATANRFPRGFANTRIYAGHLNEDGHRLTAEAIAAYLRTDAHVVHAD